MLNTALMRRAIALALALGLLAPLGQAHAAAPAQSALPQEVIVKLNPGADARAFAARHGLAPLDQLTDFPIYRFAIVDGSSPNEKAAKLDAQAGVINAEPNLIVLSPWAQRRQTWVVTSGADDYTAQWAPERIGLAAAQAVTRGAEVTVAILDTGIDSEHPALKGHLAAGRDFVDGDSDPSEVGAASADAAFGHGTHVAGLVALVAPEARILPLRTLRPDGSGDLWTQIVALRYAVDSGAQVINLSFSFGQRSRIFDGAVAAVTCTVRMLERCGRGQRGGAIVVAAAGNSGAAIREFPGATSSPGLIGVAASDEADGLATFSTYGSWLRIAAPGESIVSTIPGGGYASWSGTSMATPLVAGTAALVRSAFPELGPAETARRLLESATAIDAPVNHRLNAAAAVGAPCADSAAGAQAACSASARP